MKTLALSSKTLTLALAAALATSSPATATSLDGPTSSTIATDALTAVVAFGGRPGRLSQDTAPTFASAIPVISPADAAGLAPEASRHLLAMVDATSLPLAADEELTLSRLFGQGSPVLLHMDARAPDDLARVSALFGIAPTTGDVIVRNNGDAIDVFTSSPESVADMSALLHALVASTEPAPPEEAPLARLQGGYTPEADDPNSPAVLPGRHFDVNIVDSQGEISGVTGIDIVRSRTVSSDFKLITVTSKATVKTANNGVSDGGKTGKNAWTADLPLEYRLRHTVSAGTAEVTYLDHFPVTDGRTDFTQTDTEVRGFTIGGSTGSEISSTGKADETLAAKVPFNLSFGYEHKWQSSLTTTFQDYSIQATPQAPGSVTWKALIAPRLENVLIKRWGADMPILTEDRMTPMMRATTFEAMSYWKVPGMYAGLANVTIAAGYDLDRKKWWWNRTRVEHSRNRVPRDVALDFVIDLTDPYLSAEITVLIRTATGSGSCLSDHRGVVDLAPCRATDRSQMWGLDAASRYVNRGSGRCLAAQPATNSVITESCANITFEKQWQWRADRLHSRIDHGRYRLYVEGGQVRYAAPEARFPDFPVNPYSPALEPWTNYPSAPRAGIDHIMGPAGSRTLEVGKEYEEFPRVSDDQRWYIEILRQGL
ncbi:MAG TPA: RICIN domain-containing protein [Luteibacter sp.]|uniref:RICIN domain-containing protein n=1 Tax=Luteibacter sp. TaxID=1886636 RepID=UPI002CE1CAC8|nr:RICIN domain-containing protein [Luteibacter sp.]HVI55135.1 RICIN domain-containing protein [Luteibacter sp.]